MSLKGKITKRKQDFNLKLSRFFGINMLKFGTYIGSDSTVIYPLWLSCSLQIANPSSS
jgi:hypothetical protein